MLIEMQSLNEPVWNVNDPSEPPDSDEDPLN